MKLIPAPDEPPGGRKAIEQRSSITLGDEPRVRDDNDAANHLYKLYDFIQYGDERPDYYLNGESRKVLHRSLVAHPFKTE